MERADGRHLRPRRLSINETADSPVPAVAPSDDGLPPRSAALRGHAKAHARQVLTECQGNVSEAARRLGIGRNTLYRMLGK